MSEEIQSVYIPARAQQKEKRERERERERDGDYSLILPTNKPGA